MKKQIVTHFFNFDPTNTENIGTGFNLGQEWINTTTGEKFYHKTDGVWRNISFTEVGGATNKVVKRTASNTLVDSNITDTGAAVNVGVDTSVTGSMTATTIVKSGGLPSQFLKADGTTDATLYAPDSEINRLESTGLKYGAVITVNADPTKFNIAAGEGLIVNSSNFATPTRQTVVIPSSTANVITGGGLASRDVTYISIDSSGAIYQQATLPTPQEKRARIFLGRLNHSNRVSISFADTFPDLLQSPMSQYFDLVDSLAPFNKSGNILVANGANLRLNKGDGFIFNASFNYVGNNQTPNVVNTVGLTGLTFRYLTRTGGDSFTPASITRVGTLATVTFNDHNLTTGDVVTITGATDSLYNINNVSITTTGVNTFTYTMLGTPAASPAAGTLIVTVNSRQALDPFRYDNAGVLTSLGGANNAKVDRVYLFPSNNIRIQRGQTDYASFAAAIAGLENEAFVVNPTVEGIATLIGYIVTTRNATSLLNTTTSKIIGAPKFGGSSGSGGSVDTLQSAYSNSTTPEITTDATRGAFSVQRGSASDADNIYEGKNGAGATNFSVTGNGLVTGQIFVKVGTGYNDALIGDGSTIKLESGAYVPTLTNLLNVTNSSLTLANYTMVGNIVSVTISGLLEPTSPSADTTLKATLPFPTATTTQEGVGSGVISSTGGGEIHSGLVTITAANEVTLLCFPTFAGVPAYVSFSFSYSLI